MNKRFVFKSLLTMPSSNFLPLTFPPIIWIFTEGKGDGIESRLPFKTFYTLALVRRACVKKYFDGLKWQNFFHDILFWWILAKEPQHRLTNKQTKMHLYKCFQLIVLSLASRKSLREKILRRAQVTEFRAWHCNSMNSGPQN